MSFQKIIFIVFGLVALMGLCILVAVKFNLGQGIGFAHAATISIFAFMIFFIGALLRAWYLSVKRKKATKK